MIHPRLSIRSLISFQWSFEQDLALWRELGARWAGTMFNKLEPDVNGSLARMREAGIGISTVIGPGFNLREPASWNKTRDSLSALLDSVAAQQGRSVYITTGRTTGAPWGEVLGIFAEAVAPCVAHGLAVGVRLAFEPSQRTDVSFVNTIRDSIDVAERTSLGIVVDFGNCWMERDFREVMARAAPHIALVQVGDVPIGTPTGPGSAPPGGRVPFGEGDLPLERMFRDIVDTGYDGPFELEMPGPQGEAEGYAPFIRRGAERASALLNALGL
jgi:sugar phosphate isomerase/epimerase